MWFLTGYSILRNISQNAVALWVNVFVEIIPLNNYSPDNYPYEVPPGQLPLRVLPPGQLLLNIFPLGNYPWTVDPHEIPPRQLIPGFLLWTFSRSR